MKATGIVRRIDDLGRVVIPKEIRRTMRIREGDPLEIYPSTDGEVVFRKYSALGDMGEVGEQGKAFHLEVGAYARERGVQHLFTLGTLAAHAAEAFGDGAQHCADMPALIEAVRAALPALDVLAVKGSRFMRMERLEQALQEGGATC